MGLVSSFSSLALWCFLSGGFRYISVFLPSVLPSSRMPLVISPLALLPFLRSSCGNLFCPFSYGVFSFSSSSFGGFGLLHSQAYSSPYACSCLCSLGVPCTSDLPSSGVSIGWGGCSVGFCTGVASGSYRCCLRLLQVLPQAPTGVSSLSTASPLLSVPPPAVPSSSLPASQPQGSFLLPLLSCLRLPWRGLSLLLLAWALLRWFLWFLVYLSVLYLALRYFQLPLFCSAPLGSSAGLYGFAYPLSGTSEAPCLPAVILLSAPGFQRPLLLLLFALLLLTPLQVSLAFPRLRLAPYLVSLALLRLLLRCLGLLRLLPSSSLSVWLGSYCPFAPGLLLWSLPVLWLQFLRLSFLTFACLRLRWCLPCISIVIW